MTVNEHSTFCIIWADSKPIARRGWLVRQVIESSRLLSRRQAGLEVSIQLQECTSVSTAEIMVLAKPDASPIFVVVTEDELATFTDGAKLPRVPCASIQLGYDLIRECGQRNDVYFVIKDGRATGIDVLSLLASGARGVIGVEALYSAEVMVNLANDYYEAKRSPHAIVVGEPKKLLDHLIELAQIRVKMEPKRWDLLLALSEIPLARLPINGSPTQAGIAREIAQFESRTGYVVNSTTQRWISFLFEDILDLFDSTWEQDGLESLSYQTRARRVNFGAIGTPELPYLPLYVRTLGFPNCLLPIRDIDQTELTTLLYSVLRNTRVYRSVLVDDIPFSRVDVKVG